MSVASDPQLEEFWELVRRKNPELDRDLAEELIQLARDVPRWVQEGENHLVREAEDSLQKRLVNVEGLRATALTLALTSIRAIPFGVDDPEYPDEPFALRCWRTVEFGYTVMDQRAKEDPSYRVYPRQSYT